MKTKYSIIQSTFLLFVTIGMLLTENTGAQGWYDMDWQYRRPITVANPGGTALTNYQVMITLNSDSFDFSKANSDGSDIRLSDSDGTTLVPFWIENWNTGLQQAAVWVKIPIIPSGGTTAYLYYGNTTATATSDGAETFALFDDTAWVTTGGNLNPVHVATQPWWEGTVSYPIVFEDNSFPERPRFHMLYDGHAVIGHAKGYATSPDLITWTSYDNGLSGSARINPIMGVGYSGSTQFAWGDVIKIGTTYHMFPSSGPGTTVHCQSTDLIHWTNQSGGSVTFDALNSTDPSGIGAGVAILKEADGITPIVVDNKYWMVYFHGFSGGSMYMAYADVSNLLNWTTCYSGNPVLVPSGWEGGSLWTPSFVGTNDTYYIYYQGGSPYKIGFASAPSTSGGNTVRPDQTTWTKSPNNPVITNIHGWDNGFCQDPVLRCFDGVYYLFYTGDPPWTNGFAYSNSPEGPWTQYGESGGGGETIWAKTGIPVISNGLISFTSGQAIQSLTSFSPGHAIGYRANYGISGGGFRWGGFIDGMGSTGGNDRVVIENYPNNTSLYLQTYPSYNLLTSLDNQFHIYEILWTQDRADAIVDHGLASAFSLTNIPNLSLPIQFHNHTEPTPFQLDWIFLREYSRPEPISNVGQEQTFYPEPPEVISPVVYCRYDIAVPLTAIGANLLWYTTPTGGSGNPVAPTPSTDIPGTTSYYVSQTLNGFESDRAQIDVIVNETPGVPTADIIQPTCTISTGTITVTSSIAGLTFSIDGVNYSNTTGVFTELNPGNYNLSAKNSYNCISPETALEIIAFPGSPPAPTAILTQPTCNIATGTITITDPTGPGMTYSKDGIDYSNTTGIFMEVLPGIYILTAKNIDGCISPFTSVTINPAPETPEAPTAEVTQPTCNVPTGTIIVTSPITGLFFSIDGEDYSNNTGIFSEVAAGTYDLTAKNSSNCISPPTVVIVYEAPSNISGTLGTVEDSICMRNPFQLQLIEATGLPPYTLVVNGREYSGVNVGYAFATIPTTDETIWDAAVTPASTNTSSTPYELGVKFKATADGYIKGIRFYKNTGNSGTHIGRLWTADGTLLESAKFTDETLTGWQQVLFTNPVAIAANTTYVASYSDPAGHFSFTMPYFNETPVMSTNGLLETITSTTGSPANGVYNTTVGEFPNTSHPQSPNYWVDVVFAYSIETLTVTNNLTSFSDSGGCTITGNPLSTAVITIINPAAPQVNSPVIYNQGDISIPLTAEGMNLFWYTTPTGGTGNPNAPIPSTDIQGTTSYYVSQNISGCESPRAQIDVIVTGEGGWFDENWQHRRTIVISNPAETPLTEYQIMVTLDDSFDFSKANPDGTDIRVTEADGMTLVPFWIESWNPDAEEAIIWIKMAYIPNSGTTGYLYFGNPDATSLSDGISTFLLFDDDWEMSGINSNPVQVTSQSWWESQVSYPIVFEDNSFPDRPRFHMLYDGHFVIGHAKGYATSPDLVNWTSYDNGLTGSERINPIMGVGYAGGTQFAWGDFIKVGSVYHMLVSSGPGTTVHCQSTDLIHWTNNTRGSASFDALTSDDPSGIGTGVAILKEANGVTPVVVDGKYWIIYFHGFSGGSMYMAWSDTASGLLNWHRCYNGSPVLIPSGWEGTTLWTPSFTKVNDTYYTYYQGGSPYKIGFAKAPALNQGNLVRPDETLWTKSPNNPVITNTHGWDNGFCQDPTLRCFDGIYYIFYTGDPPWTNGFAYSDNPEGPWIQYGEGGGGQNIWTKTGTPSISDGMLNLGNGQGVHSVYSYSPGHAIGYRANFGESGSGSRWGGFISGTGGAQGNDRAIIENYPDNTILNLSTHPSYTYLTTMDNAFHIYEVLWGQGRADAILDHSSATVFSTTNVPVGNLPLTLRNYNSTYSCQFDWIFIRKYFSPEPVAVTGNDQTFKTLELSVFLEGPFNGTEMNTYLNDIFLIPLTQPYNTVPWYYDDTESLTDMPDPDVVDWILVELRDAPNAASATLETQIARQAALLLKDGSIVGLDGFSPLEFYELINNHLFVVIWHRNHLGILSSEFLIESNGIYAYDFSTSAEKAYGGSAAQKQLGSGIWGMIGGDGSRDGTITSYDKSPIWDMHSGTQGYMWSDYNLDSQTNNKDKNDIWFPNPGTGCKIPE